MTRTIFLVGYMCSGKTTLGRSLAKLLGIPFYDLDEMVEQMCQMPVTEIFERMGEQHFRRAECLALEQMAGLPVVVACGGGTPCMGDNLSLMNNKGITVWLYTTPEVIAARLLLPEHKRKRPTIALLDDEEILPHVQQSMAWREPYYAQSQLRFDATHIDTEQETIQAAKSLAQLIGEDF